MKTKAQKKVEMEKGKKFLGESQALVFSDLTNVPTKDLNRLRKELKKIGSNVLVIKKRLLALIFKESGIEVDLQQFKIPTATIFSKSDVEEISSPIFKFFSSLNVPEGKEKDVWTKHILGAYDLKEKIFVDAKRVMVLGKLPSREVALGHVFAMIAAPIRAFLYILKQKAERSEASPSGGTNVGPKTDGVIAPTAESQPTQQETK